MSYFVFGLPRSRTAWMSVFLSQSGTHCHHEAINGCRNISDYIDKIDGCGDSTTAFSYIDNLYHGSPVVVIDKNDIEFERSVKWCNSVSPIDLREAMTSQRDLLMSIDGLRVNQSDIDSRLPEIFEHLTGEVFLPHYAELSRLNITSSISNIDTASMLEFMRG